MRQESSRPLFDAILSLWVDTAVWRERYENVFRDAVARYHGYLEITPREILCIAPLLILTVLLGVWPRALLDWMQPSVNSLVQDLAGIFKASN